VDAQHDVIMRYTHGVSLFRVNVIVCNPKDESMSTQPIEVRVDAGSELTWLPADQLSAIGIRARRKRTFMTATGDPVEREVGYAVLASEGYETIDEVVLGEKGDLCLLGVRTIEGFGVLVDALGHRFVAVNTVAAGSQQEGT
jgi:predicted aspartyl protease